jgi:regulator of protease activity HflC (stomatin/prohibitin superfamily)
MSEEHHHPEHEHETPEEETQQPVGHRALADALSLSFTALKVAMAALVVLYLMRGFFFCGADEVKIKLRFGRPVKVSLGADRGEGYVIDAASGWHYAWPWEEVETISLSERSLGIREAFSASQMGQQQGGPEGPGLNPKTDNYIITGDVNVVHVQLQARYRPRSDEEGALDYAFRMKPQEAEKGQETPPPPAQILRRLVIASTLETVSSWGVLDVWKKTKDVPGRAEPIELFDEIEDRVRRKLRRFEEHNGFTLGVELTAIERIQDPEVPANVQQAFDMYQQAESEKQRLISEGEQEANRITANAEGRQAEIIAEARAYKSRIVSIARADHEMLLNLMDVYRESPKKASILREWHYQRMVEELLGEAEGSFVLHQTGEGSERELWLQLGRPAKKADRDQGPPQGPPE